ncbi:hypothetical protein C6A87_006665 [Mycobacterium sp. ITM-2016-00317]|uniref:hypothetical protein n=1 Tax=Mycobacterium sp. ITM-2016-00317 TaxID=2099694 RepID=UPI00287F8189|nr:hypothetical protein [Mycobacterium sp. ITM-2016-00317]WNG90564.1 hypothetical protein C6A87_006665 [Mycobacterium sp. ITM-2016-00317]
MIDELRTCSVLFDQLWVHHDVVKHGGGLLLVSDHIMSTYWADPGSPSERALRRLTVCEVS